METASLFVQETVSAVLVNKNKISYVVYKSLAIRYV